MAASSPWKSVAITLFVSRLAPNFACSLIFFGWHQIGWACRGHRPLDHHSAHDISIRSHFDDAVWFMTPYLAWVSFASVLNEEYWRVNR